MAQDNHTNHVELERRALKLKNDGKISEAADLLSELLRREPRWEHGYGSYALADCLERLGRIEAAKDAYLCALSRNPTDRIFLAGYASFLYLHGDLKEAFDWHLKLLAHEWRDGDFDGGEQTKVAIRSLAQKMLLTNSAVELAIESAVRQISP